MTSHEVIAEREGRWWVFTMPTVDMVGQARNLAEVESEARSIIAATLELKSDLPERSINPEDIDIRVTVNAPEGVIAQWREAEREENEANLARSHAAALRREVVRELRDMRYTAEDAGRILGVSRQRINQLEKA